MNFFNLLYLPCLCTYKTFLCKENILFKFYLQHAIAEIINFFQFSDDIEDTDIHAMAIEELYRVVEYSKDKVVGWIKNCR